MRVVGGQEMVQIIVGRNSFRATSLFTKFGLTATSECVEGSWQVEGERAKTVEEGNHL